MCHNGKWRLTVGRPLQWRKRPGSNESIQDHQCYAAASTAEAGYAVSLLFHPFILPHIWNNFYAASTIWPLVQYSKVIYNLPHLYISSASCSLQAGMSTTVRMLVMLNSFCCTLFCLPIAHNSSPSASTCRPPITPLQLVFQHRCYLKDSRMLHLKPNTYSTEQLVILPSQILSPEKTNIPEQALYGRGRTWQAILQPNEQHKMLNGPPLYSLYQKKHHLHELPSHHKYPQWSFGPSSQHLPVTNNISN